jgi:hypothetical protein
MALVNAFSSYLEMSIFFPSNRGWSICSYEGSVCGYWGGLSFLMEMRLKSSDA